MDSLKDSQAKLEDTDPNRTDNDILKEAMNNN